MIYLDENQVKDLIKKATTEGDTVSVRCIRKTAGNAEKGTVKGELHTLICGQKPDYEAKGTRDRAEDDQTNHVLTVWALNRMTGKEHGAWRRVNLAEVQEVRYKEEEFKVVHS